MVPSNGEVYGGNSLDERRVLTMLPILAFFCRRGNAVLNSTETERLEFPSLMKKEGKISMSNIQFSL